MKRVLNSLAAGITFITVFFLHIYFALLVFTKPALAQTTTEPVAAEASAGKAEKVPAPPKNLVVPKPPKAPPKPPAPPEIEESTDINVKFDMKNGVEIKGLDKVIEKLERLEKLEKLGKLSGSTVNVEEVVEDAVQSALDHNEDRREERRERRRERRGYDGPGVAILVPLGFFALIFAVVFLYLNHRQRSRREYLETVRLLVEKGQPIPPDLMQNLNPHKAADSVEWNNLYQSHLIKGLKPIFWGVGIMMFFVFNSYNVTEWFFGFVCILVGAYYIVRSHLIQKEQKNKAAQQSTVTDTTNTPQQ